MEHEGYLIKNYPKSPNLKIIVTAGKGGKIPEVMSGAHLSAGDCIKCIDKYLSTKVVKNAKGKSTAS
tara:strand:+ start:219 stop:419 length:201 start_codon:yes stop_codon:yes gene_type:complete